MVLNIYIDSDVLVSSEIRSEDNYSESKKFMNYVLKSKKSDIQFFTSLYTLLELASAMIRRTKKEDKAYSLIYRVTKSWKKFINPLPPMKKGIKFENLIDNLIESSIKFKTPAGDTIHAHTFAEYELDYFITWNIKHFKGVKKEIKNIKILTPTDVLKEFDKLKKSEPAGKEFEYLFKETLKRLLKERNKIAHGKK